MTSRAALLVSVLALVVAGCGGGDAGPGKDERAKGGQGAEPTTAVAGGTTTVRLDEVLARTLDATGATLEPTGRATRVGADLRFPITGGELDPAGPEGVVEHAGGLRIEAGGRTVEVSRIEVDARAGEVTGESRGRRQTLFRLETTSPRRPAEGDVAVLEGTLQTPEGSFLARRLGVPLPAGGLPVGRLVVSAERPAAGG